MNRLNDHPASLTRFLVALTVPLDPIQKNTPMSQLLLGYGTRLLIKLERVGDFKNGINDCLAKVDTDYKTEL